MVADSASREKEFSAKLQGLSSMALPISYNDYEDEAGVLERGGNRKR